MIIRLFSCALMLLLVSACGRDAPSTTEPPSAELASGKSTLEPTAVHSRLLQPMSDAEWRANIKDHVGCSLLSEGQLLLLVILGEGSIAKTGGTIRKLSGGDSGFDWRGGRYETEGLTIDVRRPSNASSDALVTVASGSQREQFQGDWGCGS